MRKLTNQLMRRREHLHYTKAALGRVAGVTRNSIARIENPEFAGNMNRTTVLCVLKALRIEDLTPFIVLWPWLADYFGEVNT